MPKRNDTFQATFSKINQDPYNERVKKAVMDGKIAIGYTCSYVPTVLIKAFGLVPLRVRAPGVTGTEIADIYLSSVTCSYTRSILEFAMDDRYDFLGGWVFAASCDHLRRLFDNLDYLNKPDFNYILDVPHRSKDAAIDWFIEELSIFRNKLSDHFGISVTDDDISEAIEDHNKVAALIRSIGDFRKEQHPRISGYEFHNLVTAFISSPTDIMIDDLIMYREYLDTKDTIKDARARFLLVGGQLDNPNYIDAIETSGSIVVADYLCTGSIPGFNPIKRVKDPVSDIAVHYLKKTSCPRMMEDFDERVNEILNTYSEYKADGIIIEYIKFCDTWGVESIPLVEAIKAKGIPVLLLDRDYQFSAEGQLKTRVQAFLESMGR